MVERNTHLLAWLEDGYTSCQHGSKEWAESYLHNARDVIIDQDARIVALERQLAEARAERDRLIEKGFDLITKRDNVKAENVRLTSRISDATEDKARWQARAEAAEAERDRLAASRDGYAKAEKARADEQSRLAEEVAYLRKALRDIDRRYINGADADTLVRIARLAAATQPGGQI